MSSNVEPFRVRKLRETSSVSLVRFDHPHGGLPTAFSAHETSEQYQINVVQSGFFRLRYGRREWTLGEGSMFISRPTDEYRYSHVKHVQPDTCLRVDFFPREMAGELADVFNCLSLVLPGSNRLGWLAIQLGAVAEDDPALALESVATEMLEAATTTTSGGSHLYRANQLKWYGRRIGAARELMDADPAAHHSLWRLASEVSMSPFQFARVFRELVGIPPHRYLVRLRLARARSLLQSGVTVTDACYAAGFNNLSHFVRSFHRAFAVSPSKMRPGNSGRRE